MASVEQMMIFLYFSVNEMIQSNIRVVNIVKDKSSHDDLSSEYSASQANSTCATAQLQHARPSHPFIQPQTDSRIEGVRCVVLSVKKGVG